MPLPPKVLMADMICSGSQMLLYIKAALPVRIGDRLYDIKVNKGVRVLGGMPPMVTLRYVGDLDEFTVSPDRIQSQWVKTDDWLKGKYDPPVGSSANPHPPIGSK